MHDLSPIQNIDYVQKGIAELSVSQDPQTLIWFVKHDLMTPLSVRHGTGCTARRLNLPIR